MNEDIQSNFIKVKYFFCGLHFLVGLADQTEASLKAWDRLLYDDRPVGSLANGGYSKGGSGTLRLIRTTYKQFRHMDVKHQVVFLFFISFYVKRLVFLIFLLFVLKEIDLMCYFIMVAFFTFFIII